MSTSVEKRTKILTVLVACLIALAAVQMYFLYQAHYRTDGTIAKAATESDPDNASSGMQTFKLAPTPQSQNQGTPLSGSLVAPFNPGSWDPFKEMDAMHKEMEKMFSQAFGRFSMSPQFGNLAQGFSFNPDADMSETDTEYVVKMDIPGVDKSKINVQLDGQTLNISGTREEETQGSSLGKGIARERTQGAFERAMTLPGPVKRDGMKVDYEKGVLTVTVPKDTAAPKPQSLPIQ